MGYLSASLGSRPRLKATSQHDIQKTYPKLSKSKRSQMTINHTSVLKQATGKYWNITDHNHRFHQYDHPNRTDPKSCTHKPNPCHNMTSPRKKSFNHLIPIQATRKQSQIIDRRLKRLYQKSQTIHFSSTQEILESNNNHLNKFLIEYTWHITMVGYESS